MKNYYLFIISLYSCIAFTQNIQVDSQSYSPQELIEDVLIDSDCISNIVVTNVVGGNFGGTDQSYGYFDATGTSFPFQKGIVLSTGKLSNVPGPNNTLSDDDATGWGGDNDLEQALDESNTHNATILEFDFQAISDEISFRYLFASEEYQEGNSSTCNYSDLFGFLIRPANQTSYTNIALVPGTNTPVKVTTVHSGIPGSCSSQNETYFGGWNNSVSPINFNGQTAILTARAQVRANETYHVKLVIADEHNYRYDSAVFLEAGSFQLRTDLGLDRLKSLRNPICEDETLDLDATQPGGSYKWFKDGAEILGENNPIYTVDEAGIYTVEVELAGTCISYGGIAIEYALKPTVNQTTIIECDADLNGLTTYNLPSFEQDIINNGSEYIADFFTDENQAIQNTNPIPNSSAFENTVAQQIIYARVVSEFGCFSISEITLDISNNTINILPFEVCDNDPVDGFTTFNLNNLRSQIEALVPTNSTITFYQNESDLLSQTSSIDGDFINRTQDTDLIYVRITNNGNCYATSTVTLNVKHTPVLEADDTATYCINSYPSTTPLNAGVLSTPPTYYNYQWLLNGVDIGINTETININEIGIYTVIVSTPNTCSVSREITVLPSDEATIDAIEVTEASTNNTITINVSGAGDYEFSLGESGVFQDNNVFSQVSAGFHTVYVRDKNGCGTKEELVSVLGFPKFFTPNGDTYNDTWKPLGISTSFNRGIDIKIFNRFGQLLKNISHSSTEWNGSFNGTNLPSDDYWYLASLPDGKAYRGHFTLKR